MSRRLPPLPSVGDIIRLYGLKAKANLSQNFLLDLNVTDKIVRVAGDLRGCCVCEVGPGPGALTRSLLNAGVEKLIVVEKDQRFLPSLELLREASNNRLHVYYGDALEFKIEQASATYVSKTNWEDAPNFHVVGNLPFNVSLPLLLQWLSMIASKTGPFCFGRTQLTLTFQKEVAERIIATPGNSQRSRLSIMAQHLCDIKWGFKIKGSSFIPPPKVDAVVLKFTPLITPRISVEFSTVEKVVKAMFQHRRKIIKKGAMLLFADHQDQDGLVKELFMLSGVRETLRAQQVTMEEFDQLCQSYNTLCNNISNSNTSTNNLFDVSKNPVQSLMMNKCL